MTPFEEYKLFIDDSARFSERRQTITNTYITINGAIAAFITFLIKDSRLTSWWLVVALVPLIGFGILVCIYWRQLIEKYRLLVKLRIDTLRDIESKLAGSVQMYHREDSLYPRDQQGQTIPGQGLNFSDLEGRMPLLFIALYMVLWLGLALGTLFVSTGFLPPPALLPTK